MGAYISPLDAKETALQKFEIQVGQEYVLREGKGADAPLHRVKIIQHVRGKKWKAEWIDPNPGLVD